MSCCMALLYLTMITNCMFFRSEGEKPQKVEAINVSISFSCISLLFKLPKGKVYVFDDLFNHLYFSREGDLKL